MRFLLTLALASPLLGGSHPPGERAVPPEQIFGSTLCVRNADGSSLLLDAPGPEWRWREYGAGGGWSAYRPTDEGGEERVLMFARIWGMAECSRLMSIGSEQIKNGVVVRTESCSTVTLPEPGTIRLVTTLVFHGREQPPDVGYYTPLGYHFSGSVLPNGGEDPDTLAILHSYRLSTTHQCGPTPQFPVRHGVPTKR
jgi:hypothetical protein